MCGREVPVLDDNVVFTARMLPEFSVNRQHVEDLVVSARISDGHDAFGWQRRRPEPRRLVLEKELRLFIGKNVLHGNEATVCCLATAFHGDFLPSDLGVEPVLLIY